MTIKFNGNEYDDDLTLKEFAAKLGEKRGFVITANSLKRIPKLETYNVDKELTAQEIVDLC